LAAAFPTRWLFLLGALIAIAPLSIDMYLPAFPAIERSLAASPGDLELTLASFFIGLSLGQLAYGPLSDRFGRRPPLFVGISIYCAASLGCALAEQVTQLAAWRLVQGLGGCAGLVISRAIVRDRCAVPEAARAFSMLMLVMGLAPIVAPLLGGWVVTFLGWRTIFGFLVGFSAVCLVGAYRALVETHDIQHQPPLRLRGVLGDYVRMLRSRAFLGYTLMAALVSAGMFAYIAGSPFVLMTIYRIPPQHYGWAFGLNALGLIAASQLNARSLRRIPLTRVLRHALWAPMAAGTGLALCSLAGWLPLPVVLAGFFVYVTSLGFINPNAAAAALATHGHQAGTASALMGGLQFGFATLAGIIVGRWHDGTALPLTLVMALSGIGAWLVHRWVVGPVAEIPAEPIR
jgi:DHA1 family bicyclomycin/chloramphenicol resistance-like MFS transporter